MQDKSLKIFDARIQRIKEQLAALGPLRPGTLSRQYRQPRRRQGAYYQISYTFRMQSHTEYVRPGELPEIREELAAYRRYKRLTARWLQLALWRSQGRLKAGRLAAPQSKVGGSRRRRILGSGSRKSGQNPD